LKVLALFKEYLLRLAMVSGFRSGFLGIYIEFGRAINDKIIKVQHRNIAKRHTI